MNRNVIKITNNMSYADGALIEPIGVGAGAVGRAEPESGDTVVVLGVGSVGLGSVASFKDVGVSKIIACDIAKQRLAVADELGADVLVDANKEDIVKRVMEETSGTGADVVVEAAGKPITFHQSIDMVRRDGKIMVVAIYDEPFEFNPSLAREGMPRASLVRNAVRMFGCYRMDMNWSYEIIKNGKVKASQLVTHTFPLEGINEAFETQMRPHESIKVMIDPTIAE
jgi:threonine dehydrogenase-like Zn-dependent dehydrogenase